MDVKGKQFALITSAIINLVGELWLYSCASVPYLAHSIYPVMVAAFIKGVGSASTVSRIGFWSYATSTAPLKWRSTFLGLIATVGWVGQTVTSAGLATVVGMDKPTPTFFYGCVTWALYTNAITYLLPDDPPTSNSKLAGEGLSVRALLRSFVDSFAFSFRDSSTTLLVSSFLLASIAKDGFRKVGARTLVLNLGMNSQKLVHYAVAEFVFHRIICAVAIPLFLFIHGLFANNNNSPVQVDAVNSIDKAPPENTDGGEDKDQIVQHNSKVQDETVIWRLELLMTRCFFVAASLGAVIILSRSTDSMYLAGSALISLLTPSLMCSISLLTIHAPSFSLSRALAGVAIVDEMGRLVQIAINALIANGIAFNNLPVKSVVLACLVMTISGSLLPGFVRRT
ncbi:hypothetical protein EIP91_002559 [Steccherinum ochraceum]|uniref:Uncharacterized protein n=1 Tax=Steccherinum ochraceum TaxID=92696 RepID=A0A4R0RC03_9APHY|nr:hypothetical protein EIP91_002559 [Steccherinum ochraceum]